MAIGFEDLAEPADGFSLRKADSADHCGGYVFLLRHAGVRGFAGDGDLLVFLSNRSDDQLRGKPSVDVEAHDRPGKICGIKLAHTIQAALLAHRQQK